MPLGCIYMYSPHCVTAIGVPVRQWQLWAQQGCYILYMAWGFSRCSFRLTGALRRPLNREASDSAGLHAFFLSLHYFS